VRDTEQLALELGVIRGRREAAERTAQWLRSVVANWAQRIGGRGFVLGNLLAGVTRSFVEDLETEAGKIEAAVAVLKTQERQAQNALDTAKAPEPRKWWK
jgi:hypothetical protein